MLKWILFYFSFFLSIILSFVGYIYNFKEDFLANSLTTSLGTPVKIKTIDISENCLKLKGVRVQNSFNPDQNSLVVEKIVLKMSTKELLKCLSGYHNDKVVIHQIRVEHPEMLLEFQTNDAQDNNWAGLLKKAHSIKAPVTRLFEVKKITIENAHMVAKYPTPYGIGNSERTVDLRETINIGSDVPVSIKEIATSLFQTLYDEAKLAFGIRDQKPSTTTSKSKFSRKK